MTRHMTILFQFASPLHYHLSSLIYAMPHGANLGLPLSSMPGFRTDLGDVKRDRRRQDWECGRECRGDAEQCREGLLRSSIAWQSHSRSWPSLRRSPCSLLRCCYSPTWTSTCVHCCLCSCHVSPTLVPPIIGNVLTV